MTDTKVEIQIRTIAMDFWASLEHKIYYKFEGNAPAHIREELRACSEITATLDKRMHDLNEEIKHISNPDGYLDYAYGKMGMIKEEYFGTISEEVVSSPENQKEIEDSAIEIKPNPFSLR